MKRVAKFLAWNTGIAVAFFAFWALLVLLDARASGKYPASITQCIYILSLAASFVAFTTANYRIMGDRFGLGVLAGVLIAPLTCFVGLIVMANLKFLFGGAL